MSSGFHRLKVEEVRVETDDARSIRFAVPEELRAQFQFRPGQHLTLRTWLNGEEIRRNYSLCVAPQEGTVEVTVKRMPAGRFSNWANDHLRSGDEMEVMPPHGSFTFEFQPGAAHHYVAFAVGSGITPVISILKAALLTEPESRFTLFYGNRDSQSVIFLEELARLKNRFLERLEVHHLFSRESGDVELLNGRLDEAKCGELLDAFVDPSRVAAFFVCGPGAMMEGAEAALHDRGVPRDHVHLERFTAGGESPAVAAQIAMLKEEARGLEFLVTLDGRKRRIGFDPAAGNILDSARAAGLAAPYACKAGVCATCRARIVAGGAEMAARYGLTDEEIAAGYILTCQSVPKGPGLEVDYDA